MQLNCNSSSPHSVANELSSPFVNDNSINEFAFDFALNEWSLKSPEEWEPIEVAQWIRCWALNNGVADIDIAHLLYTPVSGFELCRLDRQFFTAICPQFGAAIFDSLQSLLSQYRNAFTIANFNMNLNLNAINTSQNTSQPPPPLSHSAPHSTPHSISVSSSPPLSSISCSSSSSSQLSHFCFPSAFPNFDLMSANSSFCLSDIDAQLAVAIADSPQSAITAISVNNHNVNSSSPSPPPPLSSSSPPSTSSSSTTTFTQLSSIVANNCEDVNNINNICSSHLSSLNHHNEIVNSSSFGPLVHSSSATSSSSASSASSSSSDRESDRESTSSALSAVNERKPQFVVNCQSIVINNTHNGHNNSQLNSNSFLNSHSSQHFNSFCSPIDVNCNNNVNVNNVNQCSSLLPSSLSLSSSASSPSTVTINTSINKRQSTGRRGRPPKKDAKSRNKGNGKLWEFIRDLLLSPATNPTLIRWERREDGIFKFVQSDRVAKMWGQRKQNPRMTYEKLSRAMRYYYKSAVLLPVFGRRLVYKFGPNATGWRPIQQMSTNNNNNSNQ